jgi:salicylate hydroxylase
MTSTRVGVIGAGIAGPILAIFLKSKGYNPTVYERAEAMVDSGIGHGYVYR